MSDFGPRRGSVARAARAAAPAAATASSGDAATPGTEPSVAEAFAARPATLFENDGKRPVNSEEDRIKTELHYKESNLENIMRVLAMDFAHRNADGSVASPTSRRPPRGTSELLDPDEVDATVEDALDSARSSVEQLHLERGKHDGDSDDGGSDASDQDSDDAKDNDGEEQTEEASERAKWRQRQQHKRETMDRFVSSVLDICRKHCAPLTHPERAYLKKMLAEKNRQIMELTKKLEVTTKKLANNTRGDGHNDMSSSGHHTQQHSTAPTPKPDESVSLDHTPSMLSLQPSRRASEVDGALLRTSPSPAVDNDRVQKLQSALDKARLLAKTTRLAHQKRLTALRSNEQRLLKTLAAHEMVQLGAADVDRSGGDVALTAELSATIGCERCDRLLSVDDSILSVPELPPPPPPDMPEDERGPALTRRATTLASIRNQRAVEIEKEASAVLRLIASSTQDHFSSLDRGVEALLDVVATLPQAPQKGDVLRGVMQLQTLVGRKRGALLDNVAGALSQNRMSVAKQARIEANRAEAEANDAAQKLAEMRAKKQQHLQEIKVLQQQSSAVSLPAVVAAATMQSKAADAKAAATSSAAVLKDRKAPRDAATADPAAPAAEPPAKKPPAAKKAAKSVAAKKPPSAPKKQAAPEAAAPVQPVVTTPPQPPVALAEQNRPRPVVTIVEPPTTPPAPPTPVAKPMPILVASACQYEAPECAATEAEVQTDPTNPPTPPPSLGATIVGASFAESATQTGIDSGASSTHDSGDDDDDDDATAQSDVDAARSNAGADPSDSESTLASTVRSKKSSRGVSSRHSRAASSSTAMSTPPPPGAGTPSDLHGATVRTSATASGADASDVAAQSADDGDGYQVIAVGDEEVFDAFAASHDNHGSVADLDGTAASGRPAASVSGRRTSGDGSSGSDSDGDADTLTRISVGLAEVLTRASNSNPSSRVNTAGSGTRPPRPVSRGLAACKACGETLACPTCDAPTGVAAPSNAGVDNDTLHQVVTLSLAAGAAAEQQRRSHEDANRSDRDGRRDDRPPAVDVAEPPMELPPALRPATTSPAARRIPHHLQGKMPLRRPTTVTDSAVDAMLERGQRIHEKWQQRRRREAAERKALERTFYNRLLLALSTAGSGSGSPYVQPSAQMLLVESGMRDFEHQRQPYHHQQHPSQPGVSLLGSAALVSRATLCESRTPPPRAPSKRGAAAAAEPPAADTPPPVSYAALLDLHDAVIVNKRSVHAAKPATPLRNVSTPAASGAGLPAVASLAGSGARVYRASASRGSPPPTAGSAAPAVETVKGRLKPIPYDAYVGSATTPPSRQA